MFVLSWKLTAVTLALAPICILAAASSSFMSSNLKKARLAADDGAAAIARLSLQHPAAVKALCIEDAVAAHYGQLYDAFIAAFSPAKNSVCRILISTSFQVPLHPLTKTPNLECINTALPSSCLLPCAHTSAASLSPASKCAPPPPPTAHPITFVQVQPGFLVSFFLFLVVLASSIGQLPAVTCTPPLTPNFVTRISPFINASRLWRR
jgi:hypothetical protein